MTRYLFFLFFFLIACSPDSEKTQTEKYKITEQERIAQETKEKAEIERELENSTYLLCKTTHDLHYPELTKKKYSSGEEILDFYLRLGDKYGELVNSSSPGKFEGRTVSAETWGKKRFISLSQFAESESSRVSKNYYLNIYEYPVKQGSCLYVKGTEDDIVNYVDCNVRPNSKSFNISRESLDFSTSKDGGWLIGKCSIISREKYKQDFINWIERAKQQNLLNIEIDRESMEQQERKNKI